MCWIKLTTINGIQVLLERLLSLFLILFITSRLNPHQQQQHHIKLLYKELIGMELCLQRVTNYAMDLLLQQETYLFVNLVSNSYTLERSYVVYLVLCIILLALLSYFREHRSQNLR